MIRLRCLLVSYAEIGVNSTEHVVAFAAGLAALGWEVHVAALVLVGSSSGFRFYSCVTGGRLAPVNSEGGLAAFDVVHVWTPRGAIWDFIETYSPLIGRALILHLEDDEDEILKMVGRGKVQPGLALSAESLHRRKLDHLSHPLLARCLAACADGVTLLSPELSATVSPSRPSLRIVPPLDLVSPGEKSAGWSAAGMQTIVFSGGVHAAVADDFLSLCRAVGILVKQGRLVRLVRSGPPALPPKLLKEGASLAKNFQDAGFLSRQDLTSLLANATVLVQPGGPTVFNRRRFPSKLAPYLASGTPVVMPACYGWIGVKRDEHVIMFETGVAVDLARAIETVLDAPDQSREMGKRAAAFAREHFSSQSCCQALDQFYRRVLNQPRRVNWQSIRCPRVELPLWLAAHPALAESVLRAALIRFAVEEKKRRPDSPSQSPSTSKSDGPLVSVVVPSFNHRKFLPERFASVFAQTYRNLELVVLDDASTDGSLDYIRGLESPFPLRILPSATNSGSVFRQWHRGVSEARGEFVWIAETDDSCEPDLIEKLLVVAGRNPEIGFAYAQSQIIDESGRRIGSFLDYTEEIDRDRWRQDYVNAGRDEAAGFLVLRNTVPNASACLFRRSALLEADLLSISLKVCGDWMAYARICERHDVAFVAEELNSFRRHASTARERANRDGSFIAEAYAVQNYIADHFDVSPESRETASRSTFRDLLHLLKKQVGDHSFVDDAQILTAATRFDPRFRERLSRGRGEAAPKVFVRFLESGGALREQSFPYDWWRWTKVRVGRGRGTVTIVPLQRPGLVALRAVRALEPQTGRVLWTAENREGYRAVELDGEAQRVGSEGMLEIFCWGAKARLQLPLPANLRESVEYDLEFEIRLSDLSSYECPFGKLRPAGSKRALFIVPHFEMGGADRCNLDVIRQLMGRFGWVVTIVTTRRSADAWQASFRALTEDLFILHRFLPVSQYGEFVAYLIESRRPDVVYLSHSEAGYRLLPWLKGSFPGLPIVDLLHILMPDWKDGGFPRFSIEAQASLAGTVVTSHWLKNWLVQRGGDERRLSVVYTGIDTRFWRRTDELTERARMRWALPGDRPVILFAARFASQKSPELLLPVVEALKSRGRNFFLLLAGEGSHGSWLAEHVCLPHREHVRMVGPVSLEEMPTLMSAADILLLPSQNEGIALVLFEAMSMEVVPVATDVGGQRELVTPECGRLVTPEPNRVKSIVDALDLLLSDPAARTTMARNGRARVETLFSLERTGEQIDAWLRQLQNDSAVAWDHLPPRREIPRELLSDLTEMDAVALEGDEWSRQIASGKWLPTAVSKLAAYLRTGPLRALILPVEKRYGERLGRWLVSKS